MKSILISNAQIINEGKSFLGSVFIREGRIEKVFDQFAELPEAENHIDAQGLLLIPGVIDDQVHFREPGLMHKADIYSESIAAVAGGITSYMEMPNTIPQTTTQELLEEKFLIASQKSLANYSFYIGATNDNLDELLKTDFSKVCGVKIFMGSSTGNMLVDRIESLEKIFSQIHGIIAVHCEDEETIKQNTAMFRGIYGENIPIEFHAEIRSETACFLSSKKAVELAKKHNTRLHVLHISTEKELELFDFEKPIEDKNITAEVCVHHLWFDENDYAQKGTLIKWNPSIKKKSDKDALLNGVLSNKIDVIATDHAPHTLEEKNNSYFLAPSGGPMVQHSLITMLELVRQNKITMEKVVEKMCHAPARLFRIEKRGFIRQGYWADLVLVDPDKKWEVTKENILYKCAWSPLQNQIFSSKVITTFINGQIVFDHGNFDLSFRGKRLHFNL